MLPQAQPGQRDLPAASAFAGCEQLFTGYPLAVTPPRPAGSRSMVLMTWPAGGPRYFVLTRPRDARFIIRPWSRHEESVTITPDAGVPDSVFRVIAHGMPVPRDGALLGWVEDRQVKAMLTVHSAPPADPDEAVSFPEIRVMPMAGTSELDWPPFTSSPRICGQFWDYLDRSKIVDIGPLLTRRARQAYWVPSPRGHAPERGVGCMVLPRNLPGEEYWLPAGVYIHHWMLREGIPVPAPAHLITLPSAVDMAEKRGPAKRAVTGVPGG